MNNYYNAPAISGLEFMGVFESMSDEIVNRKMKSFIESTIFLNHPKG